MFSLGEKMEFLIANPFSTPVGQRIERATSSSRQSEDWGLNMEICDIINETDEGPRDAVKAIKKRIVGNKNFREIMLALTVSMYLVLEACVKNCGHRFHVFVASQEFVEGVLVRAILPKYNPPTALHDRVLSLIQSWADSFRTSPSLAGVVYVYDDLRRRGLEFPMTDLDALSPIHTPSRTVPENETHESTDAPPRQSQPQTHSSSPTTNTSPASQPSEGPAALSAVQKDKLQQELALVKGNITVMSEMLNELKPGQSKQDDTELLQQLYSVCKNMQTRVVELIPQLLDEGLIEELLAVNDDLNNAFIRYERFDRLNRVQITNIEKSSVSALNLIDLSPEPPTLSQPAVITTNNQPEVKPWTSQMQSAKHNEEEFDMFAQTRGSSLAELRKSVRYEDPGAVEGLAGALDSRLQVTGNMGQVKNTLQNNVDKWLSCDMQDQSAVSEGVSSEEFDKFLDDRAKESDQSNDTTSATLPSTSRLPPQSTKQQDSSHDQLFSL
ncbi:target of Myb1 membrane trafficking protein-like isoform X2 [Phyllopteryx taeniolatus]|uniref:target of Myb1 membrane trafficking protein-like isoform X2 n=1 Tax=Phyllopteryx taeniolatus TaxID=161469 RepID=UPI002AD41E5D|nr:target of Myb1 membrane trafficking protein-like isoform X2 [Phyllopteryx taeniolatus]